MYLLDTHTLLWFLTDDRLLSANGKAVMGQTDATILVNIISYWEIAIKQSIGKLELSQPLDKVMAQSQKLGFESVAINPQHIFALSTLPLHHRDPFDRLLVSHALCDDLVVIGRDPAFDAYGVKRLW